MATDRVIYPPIKTKKDQSGQWNPAHRILTISASVAVIGAVVSVALAIRAWCDTDATWIYRVLPFWIVGPPVWFWFDYFKVYRRYGDPEAFDSYKHGQQISIAIWAAFAILFGAFANADHFKTKPSPCACPQVGATVPSQGGGTATNSVPVVNPTYEPVSGAQPGLKPDSNSKTTINR